LLAAVGALCHTTLPPIVVRDGRVMTLESDDERDHLPSSWTSFPSKKLSLPVLPLPLSMGYMRIVPKKDHDNDSDDDNQKESHWLVDPSREEEKVCEGGITVVVDGRNTGTILSLDYQGQISMTQSNLALALRMAQGRAEELLPLLQEESSN
jgi:exosome complex RNA-binding protein Rrp42 (RNase PH superfamily)